MRLGLAQQLGRRWLALRRDDRGASAIEFAAVGVPFFMTIIGILVMALMTFGASSLDYAVQKASRQIMVGQTQNSNLTASQFQQTILCPLLPAGLFDCSKLLVSLTSFASANYLRVVDIRRFRARLKLLSPLGGGADGPNQLE